MSSPRQLVPHILFRSGRCLCRFGCIERSGIGVLQVAHTANARYNSPCLHRFGPDTPQALPSITLHHPTSLRRQLLNRTDGTVIALARDVEHENSRGLRSLLEANAQTGRLVTARPSSTKHKTRAFLSGELFLRGSACVSGP